MLELRRLLKPGSFSPFLASSSLSWDVCFFSISHVHVHCHAVWFLPLLQLRFLYVCGSGGVGGGGGRMVGGREWCLLVLGLVWWVMVVVGVEMVGGVDGWLGVVC